MAGGLAGESPRMISAAVKGLARLAYEFSDLVSNVYKLLPSTFLLLQRKNREIIKVRSWSFADVQWFCIYLFPGVPLNEYFLLSNFLI